MDKVIADDDDDDDDADDDDDDDTAALYICSLYPAPQYLVLSPEQRMLQSPSAVFSVEDGMLAEQ